MRFTGHERDLVNLGGQGDDLDYMHARHYGVITGRFLSVDRVLGYTQNPQSWNRYAYGLNNPTRNIDPDGRFSEDTLLGYMNAFVSDFAFGLGRIESESPDFQEGQRLGDEAAQKAGAALTGIGLTTTGVGLVAEAPTLGGSTVVVAGGLATAGYGTAVAGIATHQLMSKRTPHDEERYRQARAGDTHREVGDANRVIREGREFIDAETGNRVFVDGNRGVVVNSEGKTIIRFKNDRKNTQQRIRSGRWVPVTR